MALGSLEVHLQKQNRKKASRRRNWVTTAPGGEPCTNNMVLPTSGGPRNCPIKECWGQAVTRTTMKVNLFHWNVQDTVITLEEGNLSHPLLPQWNMLVTLQALNRRNLATNQYAKGEERKRRWMTEEEIRESSERSFQVYGRPLETVTLFKYLGQFLTSGEDNCP